MAQSGPQRNKVLWTLLVVLVGQVGCITLAVILASVFAGLWLDAHFHTRPILTLVLLVAGIPVSVLLMLQVGRKTLARLIDEKEKEGQQLP
jgi:F0F1-type ATP synthase assembly protein I